MKTKSLLNVIMIGLCLGIVGCSGAKEKSLSVGVLGTISPTPASFTGSCTYMKGGKEVTEDISGDKGNASKAFLGDFIKSCKVTKTSEGGWIQVIVGEDGNKVFDSGKVETKDPIVYEKK